jgi:ferrous-iron efflux pump FieF
MNSTLGGRDPNHAKLMRMATYASVSVAATLIVAKLFAFWLTDSVAMLSALIDSVLDVLASAVNLIAVRHALQPADAEHRFGHGKAESLAGLAQAAFIGGSGVFLVFESLQRVVRPQEIENGPIGVAVLVFSVVLTFGLVVFQRHVVRQTGSVAIAADSLHYRSDIFLNLGVILALVLSFWLGWQIADPIIAILIAGIVMASAWKIFRIAFDALMDREFPEEVRTQIQDIVMSHADVRNMHDLRTRKSGTDTFIQMHLELDAQMPLQRAHEIADEVEALIRSVFPEAEVIIHQDPEGIVETHQDFD